MKKPLHAEIDQEVLLRIRCEYLEMPGLRLTVDQARRLCGVDAETCARILDALVDAGFLSRGRDSRYSRSSEGGLPAVPFLMIKAERDSRSALRKQPARKHR